MGKRMRRWRQTIRSYIEERCADAALTAQRQCVKSCSTLHVIHQSLFCKACSCAQLLGCTRCDDVMQGIVLFRVLVRLKVFQLLGIAGISVVATTLLSGVRQCL